MPILDIEIVIRPGETLDHKLVVELANRAGEIFAAPPGSTWVKLRTISHENYAESGGNSPVDFFPVFVSVLTARLPVPDKMQIEVAKLTAAIAKVCDRPEENVHIVYLPEGAGRVSFGGKIISLD
jgi:phenylpyruvate tautomerase PptA (4-oxalocrotonate tautomerase family)